MSRKKGIFDGTCYGGKLRRFVGVCSSKKVGAFFFFPADSQVLKGEKRGNGF